MKAVIVDVKGKDAVALCANGQFEKIKNQEYSIGQEIALHAQTRHFPKQAAIAASAALLITAGGGIGTYTWTTPVSYVSLDINPSIAYSLNKFDRVIAVAGMNDEGNAIVDAIGSSLKNTDITTALTITVEQLSNDAYLDTENTSYMVIGVYSDKNNKADALKSTVDAFTESTVDTCSITTVSVSKETKETAESYGITAGKMELINEIADVAADPQEVDPAALADLTVAQLEQTKAAAATGASLSSAVASATPETAEDVPQTSNEPVPDTPVTSDPNAVVSDSKPDSDAEHTSSVAKDDAAAAEAADSQVETAAEESTDIPAANPDSIADSSTSDAPTASPVTPSAASSTEDTGTGSSIKKNDSHETKTDTPESDTPEDNQQTPEKTTPAADTDTSSPKEETTSSEKKNESSSSDKTSEKKEQTSSEKTDTVTEDDSQQTNSAPPNDANLDSTSGDGQFKLSEISDELMLADNMLS